MDGWKSVIRRAFHFQGVGSRKQLATIFGHFITETSVCGHGVWQTNGIQRRSCGHLHKARRGDSTVLPGRETELD